MRRPIRVVRRAAAMLARVEILAILAAALPPGTPLGAQGLAAQPDPERVAHALGLRSVDAVRAGATPPAIDGRLDDAVWRTAPAATDFVQTGPNPGALARWSSEVKVVYDDDALYVAYRLYDPHPDSIVHPIPRRDDETTSDWAFVEIDSRHDRRTGFSFGVNPRSVQADGSWASDNQYDSTWDGVWDATARIDSLGWTVEFRIPFSQLPHSGEPGAEWGINFYRYVARSGESSNWSPRLPTVAGIISKFNTLRGLAIAPGRRLFEVTPYVAASGTQAPDEPGNPIARERRSRLAAGTDLTYHLSPSMTLTATIHPDFGQVEADPSEINLTTFETLFTERRPFFVAGAERFRFGLGLPFHTRDAAFDGDQPFYSRRIGRAPRGRAPSDATFADIPTGTTLLGAAKLSGRTANGWSIGVLDAVTGSADARVFLPGAGASSVRVQPALNYGVARVVREADGGASAFGGIIAAATTLGDGGSAATVAPRQSLAFGADGRHRFGDDRYEVSGFALGSRISGTAEAIQRVLESAPHWMQRPDAPHLDDDRSGRSAMGFAGELGLAQIGGDHWRWAIAGHAVSPELDVNEIGFQRNADWLLAVGSVSYSQFSPDRWFNTWTVGLDQVGAGWTFGGERRATSAAASATAQLHNYWDVRLARGTDFPSLSTDALRGGSALRLPARERIEASVATDGRKTTRLKLAASGTLERQTGTQGVSFTPSLVMRTSDEVRFSIAPTWSRTVSGWQYVRTATAADGPHQLLARLTQETASLTARAIYAASSTLTVELYAQPFVSAGNYDAYKGVRDPRASRPSDRVALLDATELRYDAAARRYTFDADRDGRDDATFADPSFTTRSLNANLVLRWQYRPGSTLFVVWSQQRESSLDDGTLAFGRDARGLARAPGTNTLLVKFSRWLAFGA
jgi:uncharacterized protein DUF5916/cellulose/xylan binding protein with CBM9 domain